jgi:outer membrane protein OmpA-like peptidoglycan-associated protein
MSHSRGRKSNQNGGGHSTHLAASFTDLMASLMVIFVLLFVATVNNAATKRHTVTETLLETLKGRLTASGVSLDAIRRDDRDPYAIVIVMPEELLFKRGEWKVEASGVSYLEGMIPNLSAILCSGDMRPHIDNVVVEGHTDMTWLGALGPGESGPEKNLELSQQRSMGVVHTSLAAPQAQSDRDCFRGMLSASGRGQEEPIINIPGDDAQQRRVVFKIRVQQGFVPELTQRVNPPQERGGR